VLRQDKYTVTARHLATGKESALHHSRCHLCTTTREIAIELSRQDFPEEHTLTRILAHKGSLLDRSSLSFEALFADGEVQWLNWSAVQNTAALHSYSQLFQSTRILLAEDLPSIRARLAAPDLTASRLAENIAIPAVNDTIYVSLFAFPAASEMTAALSDMEHCLLAKVVKITRKRIDLTFEVIPGLTVAWSLLQYAAFCTPGPNPSQRVLDLALLRTHADLQAALGGPQSKELPPNRPAGDSDTLLQARLRDNTWHDIEVQVRRGNKIDAYVPSLDIEIEVPLTRTRPRQLLTPSVTQQTSISSRELNALSPNSKRHNY
jgi:hypothetical protein